MCNRRTDSQELNIFQIMVAIVFLLIKRKYQKVKLNLMQVKELIEKSSKLQKSSKDKLMEKYYLFEVTI